MAYQNNASLKQTAVNAATNLVVAYLNAGLVGSIEEAEAKLMETQQTIFEELGTAQATTGASSNGTVQDPAVAVFNFGKYKGKTIAQVHQDDPQYLEWVVENNKWGVVKSYFESLKAGV